MHLVWSSGRIFIKPIPRFLLEPDFWTEHLACTFECACLSLSQNDGRAQTAKCDSLRLRKYSLGFLFSYAALISHESDYFIAQEKRLLPKEVTWSGWKTLVKEILNNRKIYEQINERFKYGELRLSRLNMIYRITQLALLKGYRAQYSQYSSFLQDNFAWLAAAIAYLAIVLTAMQVGLATNDLAENNSFQSASYGFTVFSIVGPLVAVVFVLVVFCIAFIINWIKTKQYEKARTDAMNKMSNKTASC